MNLKNLLAAAALMATTGAAFSADQSVAIVDDTASFKSGLVNVLQGGDDVITFTGLASGTYDFLLTMSSQYITLTSVSMNGIFGNIDQKTSKITFADVEGTGQTPFILTLVGTKNRSMAQYSGELSVAAVPEPGTYAMFAAGLGALVFMARRRRQDA